MNIVMIKGIIVEDFIRTEEGIFTKVLVPDTVKNSETVFKVKVSAELLIANDNLEVGDIARIDGQMYQDGNGVFILNASAMRASETYVSLKELMEVNSEKI
jgi:hypothetical protein